MTSVGRAVLVDVLGGDHAPDQVIKGVAQFRAENKGLPVALVGPRDLVLALLHKEGVEDLDGFELIDASQKVEMADKPAEVLRRENSSIAVCAKLAASGRYVGWISAGNTGACMMASVFYMKKMPGLARPAICTTIPSPGGPFVLLDVGANSDCRPEHLVQFAKMGAAYYRVLFPGSEPRVGLLNIGEESEKGSSLYKAAHRLLKSSAVNFVGNIEARDLFSGKCDVVVCDGFVGNILLKCIEGTASMILSGVRNALRGRFLSKLGGLLARRDLKNFAATLDYEEYGGSPLLGINGLCIICHGSSRAKAIKNAIKLAFRCHSEGLIDKIKSEVEGGQAIEGGTDER